MTVMGWVERTARYLVDGVMIKTKSHGESASVIGDS